MLELLLESWGSYLAFLMVIDIMITIWIFIYENYYLPPRVSENDVFRILFHFKSDLESSIKDMNDAQEIKNFILNRELNLRDWLVKKIKEDEHTKS